MFPAILGKFPIVLLSILPLLLTLHTLRQVIFVASNSEHLFHVVYVSLKCEKDKQIQEIVMLYPVQMFILLHCYHFSSIILQMVDLQLETHRHRNICVLSPTVSGFSQSYSNRKKSTMLSLCVMDYDYSIMTILTPNSY